MNQVLLPSALGWALSAGVCGLCIAGELPDPTRPPAALRPASATVASTAPATPTLVLQSVLLGEGRKPSAIINGRIVEVGESVDGLRLVRVSDQGAILAGPGRTTALALTPGSEKVATSMRPASGQPLVAMGKGNARGSDVASADPRTEARK